ncbi:MAG: tetratricopeptide repeat protein [Balneolaceae bacterium]|jgi:tetratricopeptide (TPR) repeat protein
MKKKYIIVVILAGTFGVFGIYAEMSSLPDTAPSWNGSQAGSMMSVPDVPGAENVSGQYKDQVKQLEAYLSDNPEDTTHLLRLARLYQDGHKPESAIAYYEQLLKINPNDHQSWLDLTNCYAATGNWKKAKRTAIAMLNNFPGDEEGQYNLGAIHANTGNTEAARKLWLQLTQSEHKEIANLAKESLQKLNHSSTTQ